MTEREAELAARQRGTERILVLASELTRLETEHLRLRRALEKHGRHIWTAAMC